MSDEEDLDLLALQRRLDDAFETTRPRRGFDDELWLRLQARRPLWTRLQDGLGGLVAGLREVPAVPAAAVAVVLVVVIGVGVVSLSGLHLGSGGSTTSSSQYLGQHPGAAALPQAQAPESFGLLPAPSLTATSSSPVDSAPSKNATDQGQAHATSPYPVYLGPAILTWSGQLNIKVTQAPVFRYQEPTAAFANDFAAQLGAVPAASASAGVLGTYSGQGFTLSVRSSSAAPPGEPFFVLVPTGSVQSSPIGSATGIASAFLIVHNLLPSWTYEVVNVTAGDQVRVHYLRQFLVQGVSGQSVAYVVDGIGERYGLAVDLKAGQPVRAAGPLPLSLDTSNYPIISADQAVRAALTSTPAEAATISPVPSVQLTTAELVYALVNVGDHGFYQPAYLFSGTFTNNGTTYVKRVLVPAVDPSQRSS
ncbi:MAG TPA: hypothetical protein VGU71_02265 [Candidatus Dormibacteraeota bacterium]|nr:hypothetical protein [Candidatus Dormibacteraeota bacterium]